MTCCLASARGLPGKAGRSMTHRAVRLGACACMAALHAAMQDLVLAAPRQVRAVQLITPKTFGQRAPTCNLHNVPRHQLGGWHDLEPAFTQHRGQIRLPQPSRGVQGVVLHMLGHGSEDLDVLSKVAGIWALTCQKCEQACCRRSDAPGRMHRSVKAGLMHVQPLPYFDCSGACRQRPS